ncbi:MAG: sigma-70 family RNA polymerase sigma factor [Myxococcota bacterium]
MDKADLEFTPVKPPSRNDRTRPDGELLNGAEPPREDVAVVTAALEGDPGARRELAERYAPHVAGILYNVLGPRSPLQDVAQDVFLVVFRDLVTLRDPAALRAWITRIAVNRAQTYLRGRRRRWWLVYSDDEVDVADTMPFNHESRRAVRATYDVLNRLPARERTAFALRYVEGMSLVEVADALELSLATTKRTLRSANDRFRKHAARDPRLASYLQRGGNHE